MVDDERRTYRQLLDRAIDVARSLVGLGVRRGDHVGLLVPNGVEGVEVMFGAALAGAVVVPINVRFRSRELGHVIADGDLRVLVTSDLVADHLDFVALLHDTLPGLVDAHDPRHLDLAAAPELRSVVVLGGSSPPGLLDEASFAAAGAGVTAEEIDRQRRRPALRDPALMIYTSGTTAMPKGAPLSHEALVRTAVEAGRTRFRFVPGDRFWDPLPMFHMSFILPMIGVLDAGGTFISMVHFEPAAALAQLARERVADVPHVPGRHPGAAQPSRLPARDARRGAHHEQRRPAGHPAGDAGGDAPSDPDQRLRAHRMRGRCRSTTPTTPTSSG